MPMHEGVLQLPRGDAGKVDEDGLTRGVDSGRLPEDEEIIHGIDLLQVTLHLP